MQWKEWRARQPVTGSRSGKRLACNGLILALYLALLLLALEQSGDGLVGCQEQLTVESRQQKDSDELSDAIKYLENLDKYYSQIARPRFGRSGGARGLQQVEPGAYLFGLSRQRQQLAARPLLELLAGQRRYKELAY